MIQHFYAKKESEIYSRIKEFTNKRREGWLLAKEFADKINLEYEKIGITEISEELVFSFKNSDGYNMFKNKIKECHTKIYKFRKNTKEYKMFEMEKESVKYKNPYLELQDLIPDAVNEHELFMSPNTDLECSINKNKETDEIYMAINSKTIINNNDLVPVDAKTFEERGVSNNK